MFPHKRYETTDVTYVDNENENMWNHTTFNYKEKSFEFVLCSFTTVTETYSHCSPEYRVCGIANT